MGSGKDYTRVDYFMIDKQCHHGYLRQQGFSLFEIVVVVLLIGVLMSMAIDRLLVLQVEAEKVSVKHVIGTIDSAVYLQVAEIVLKEGLGSMRKLENTNPMDYLARLPENYVGVKTGQAARDVLPASWYFDSVNKTLVYKVENIENFESAIDGTPSIILKLSLLYRGNVISSRNGNIQGIKLKSLHDYNWKSVKD